MKIKSMDRVKCFAILIAASVLFCLSVVNASATIIIETYSGTVTFGDDFTNLFGGGDLTGKNFSAVFTYDTAQGSLINSAQELDNGLVGLSVQIGSITVSGQGGYGLPDHTTTGAGLNATGGLQEIG